MKVFLWLFPVNALAETLPQAATPTDWTAIGVALVVGASVVGAVWYFRNNPGSVKRLESLLHKQADTHAETVAVIPKALESMPPAAQLPPWERKS